MQKWIIMRWLKLDKDGKFVECNKLLISIKNVYYDKTKGLHLKTEDEQ